MIQNHGFELMDSANGIALLKTYDKTSKSSYYLQIIDIQQVRINQYCVETPNEGLNQGKYLLGEKGFKSPYFKMLSHANVQKEQQKLLGNQYFSIMNCSFFEEHKPETQLSFPIKKEGKILTGGSSPFGPIETPNHAYYKKITLKALIWNDIDVQIKDYVVKTGFPLIDSTWKNGLVSYAYLDHPAQLFRPGSRNRYHLISTSKIDDANQNVLVILTSDNATLTQAGSFFKTLNINGDIMTIDGGASVFMHNRKAGTLAVPRLLNPTDPNSFSLLPHYWVFSLKN